MNQNGIKKNKTVEGMIYGVGLGETSDRRVAKNISFASAVRDINSQLRTKVISELDVNFNDTYTEIDGDHVRDFKTGVRDNLFSKTGYKYVCLRCTDEAKNLKAPKSSDDLNLAL